MFPHDVCLLEIRVKKIQKKDKYKRYNKKTKIMML